MNPIYELLRADGSIVVNKHLARSIGLESAVMFSELISKYAYFADRRELTEDGFFFNTVENMREDTSLSDYQQRNAIKKLKSLGLVKCAIRGVPGRRYFKIVDDEKLILKYLGTHANQQFSKNSRTSFEGTQELVLEKLQSNNTNANNTNLIRLNKENDNGRHSGEMPTQPLSPFIESARGAMNYYFEVYRKKKRQEHPKLKKSQIDNVLENICSTISEYDLLDGNLRDMIDFHFKRNIATDYNINHFATEGILTNLMYEVAY